MRASSSGFRHLLFIAGFMGCAALSQPGDSARRSPVLPPAPAFTAQGTSIQWPTNTINVSQLQQMFSQFPGASQLNIQFPNQLNWAVTPDSIANVVSSVAQEAHSMGVSGKLPDLALSSLADGMQGGQLSIPDLLQGGDLKSQVDNVMEQLRYQELNLSSMLPDWLKQCIVALYDAASGFVDYVQMAMDSLVKTFLGRA